MTDYRQDFPCLKQKINAKPIVYFDNGATTLKPQSVIEAVNEYHSFYSASVHRGVFKLAQKADTKYHESRETIASFINADFEEIIFTSGATASLNIFILSFARAFLTAGDEIIISNMEHHSNIVPWQILRDMIGIKIIVVPILDDGSLDLDFYTQAFNNKTKLVSILHTSNTMGIINPIDTLIKTAHQNNTPIMLDCAQAISHHSINVKLMNVDFLVFSGHKIFAPTGIGVLYGKKQYLEQMLPVFGGGDMISSVSLEKSTYAALPTKFEAGTPNIAGAIGLGEAIKYIKKIGFEAIQNKEKDLLNYAKNSFAKLDNFRIIGVHDHKIPTFSFVLKDIHPHDIASLLDEENICIRAGHHCTEPLMRRFNLAATSRASLSFYNTESEIDQLIESIKKIQRLFNAY